MASLKLQGFEKISRNVDIMQMIFHYLNFEEQLKLAQVSQHLKYIFCNFIWKVDYTTICIEKRMQFFHVINETNLDRIKLSSSVFREFLKVYGEDINDLNEECNPCLDIRTFPNLKALSYRNMTVSKPQLQSVARYCKKLQKLKVATHTSFGQAVKTILEMKQLKYLCLTSDIECIFAYDDFQELVIKSKIKHLSLNGEICFLAMPFNFDKDAANYLEELEICGFLNEKRYENDLVNYYLSHFENLVTLTLNETTVDDDTVKVLADTCKKLKKLNINDTTFKSVTNFSLLISIEEFNVTFCNGLSQKNLRQFLTAMNLKHVSSCKTEFKGSFNSFVISCQIQSLNIDDLKTYKFKGAYKRNENLRSLVWYDDFFKAATPPVSLKCPRLEKFKVVSGFVPVEMLLQLQSLHTLTIERASNLTWSYIIQLLRDHVSLKEFKLENTSLDPESAPNEAFNCAENLTNIQISGSVFEIAIDFWLDLMGKNSHVKFECACKFKVVKNFINSPKFPDFLKTIYINGLKVACSNLRNNFYGTFEEVHSDTFLPMEGIDEKNYSIIFG